MPNPQNVEPHKFKKGKSGNPKGRTPGIPNSKTRYKRLLELVSKKANPVTGEEEEFTQLELMDMAVFNKALKGDIRAYQEIMDRLEGKPGQPIDLSVVDMRREILTKYGLGEKDVGQTQEIESRSSKDSA